MMTMLRRNAQLVRSALRTVHYHRVYQRFRKYTMIPRPNFVRNLQLARRVSYLPGSVVECGVWRGGMTAGLSMVMGSHRPYYLCDSFEGLPPARDIDGAAAIRWQRDTESPGYHDNCTADERYAAEAMSVAGVRTFQLVKGWFDKTLPTLHVDEPIALLRLDGDWYDSTMVCLESLFDKVVVDGLILIDDYYTWDGCSRAVHDFLSKRSAVERLQEYGGVCFMRKRQSS
jgi:O-methyltransferase